MEPRGWYDRGYLPHFDDGQRTQALTCCLIDAIPADTMERLRIELAHLEDSEAEKERRRRLEALFDRGTGQAWLRDPVLAGIVQQAFLHFADVRYTLHAWVVMPTHFHVLFTPLSGFLLERIAHSWKSYTANVANAYLQRVGQPFWLHESYDRYIRDERHFANEITYIEHNPVKAGLCREPADWRWSSAWWRKHNQ